MLAFGPSYHLYFSRFAREDIYFAALSLALLVVVPLPRAPAAPPAGRDRRAARARLRRKETTFITGFVAFTFFAGVLLSRRALLLRPLRAVGLEA